METIASFLSVIVQGMSIPMNIYGFTFSFWDIFLWSIIAGVVVWIVGRVING